MTLSYSSSVRSYKRRWHTTFHPNNPAPQHLGLICLSGIPRTLEDIEREREFVERRTAEIEETGKYNREHFNTKRMPHDLTPLFPWVYEVDLDNLVFWVNAVPMFSLLDPPSPKEFLAACETTATDSYGNPLFSPEFSRAHPCNVAIPPPPIPSSIIAEYDLLMLSEIPVRDLHDMLDLNRVPSNSDSVRTRWLEALTGMLFGWIPAEMLWDHTTSTDDIIGETSRRISNMFIAALTHPVRTYFSKTEFFTCNPDWPRPDVCVLLTHHLTDEPNLCASLVRLHHKVTSRPSSKIRTIYGLLFDLFACCVVQFQPGGKIVSRTPVLQFLPDRCTTSPSTPGIAALARLFNRPGFGLFEQVGVIPAPTSSSRLPVEVMRSISSHLTNVKTIARLVAASSAWSDAVEADYWRRGLFKGYEILKPIPFEEGEDLRSAVFLAKPDFEEDLVRVRLMPYGAMPADEDDPPHHSINLVGMELETGCDREQFRLTVQLNSRDAGQVCPPEQFPSTRDSLYPHAKLPSHLRT